MNERNNKNRTLKKWKQNKNRCMPCKLPYQDSEHDFWKGKKPTFFTITVSSKAFALFCVSPDTILSLQHLLLSHVFYDGHVQVQYKGWRTRLRWTGLWRWRSDKLKWRGRPKNRWEDNIWEAGKQVDLGMAYNR